MVTHETFIQLINCICTTTTGRRYKQWQSTDYALAVEDGREGEQLLLPEWFCSANISRSARELLVRILHVDPQLRLTAAEALRHPWSLGAVISHSGAMKHISTECIPEVVMNALSYDEVIEAITTESIYYDEPIRALSSDAIAYDEIIDAVTAIEIDSNGSAVANDLQPISSYSSSSTATVTNGVLSTMPATAVPVAPLISSSTGAVDENTSSDTTCSSTASNQHMLYVSIREQQRQKEEADRNHIQNDDS